MLWGIGIAMGIGTLALFANAFEQAMNQINASTSKPNPKISQLHIAQPYQASSAPINPIGSQPIAKHIQQDYIDSSQRSQKAINEKLKEYNNIASSNEIYHQKHPDRPRIITPAPNFSGIALQAYNNENAASVDDSDPHRNPSEWDSMKSKDKICWFHRTTRRKVCEPTQ